MKFKFIFLIIPLLLFSCTGNNKVKISGTVPGKAGRYIYLDRLDIETPVRVDSAEIKENGTFRFSLESDGPDFFQLGFNSVEFVTLLVSPGEKINIEFLGNRLQESYSVTGSEESEKIMQLDLKLFETRRSLDSLNRLYDAAAGSADFANTEEELSNEYLRILKEQRSYNIGFVLDNITSLSALKALYQRVDDETYVLYDPKDLQYLKIVSDSLKKYYPDSDHTKALVENVQMELNRFYMAQLSGMTRDVQESDLDISLPDSNGKIVSLSSLKGKHVLLVFWSARSQEAITFNLELKEYYRKYKSKGFEIYSVNYDTEDLWLKAIKFDELPWINVREEDPSNPRTATLYNVTGLPSTFLIGKDGTILNRDLFGRNLRIALDQIFAN